MRLDHAEDLAQFVEELKKETDRSLPLVGAALIDEKLLETLQAFFVEGKSSKRLLMEGNAPLGTFSSRIEACYSLGLIDEFEYQEVSLIRNEFGCSSFASTKKRIKKQLLSLKNEKREIKIRGL